MAHIVRLLRRGRLRRPAGQLEAAMRRPQKPGDQPQQGGLPGAVAAGDRQRFAARDGKIESLEDLAAAPHAAEIMGRQVDHHDLPRGAATKGCLGKGAWRRFMVRFVRAMFAIAGSSGRSRKKSL